MGAFDTDAKSSDQIEWFTTRRDKNEQSDLYCRRIGIGEDDEYEKLDPKTTYYIDADCKGLSWKGWRNQYNTKNKNYKATDDTNIVRQYIKKLRKAVRA